LSAAGVPCAGSRAGHQRTPQHGVALPGEADMTDDERSREEQTYPHAPARIPSTGSLRELGPFGWAFCKPAARRQRIEQVNLFTTLALHGPLLLAWLPYSAYLLFVGKLSRKDAELVILRVGHLRNCEYELQQHRRLARTRGVDADLQARIFEGP